MRPADTTESMLAEHDRQIHSARLERLGGAAEAAGGSADLLSHKRIPLMRAPMAEYPGPLEQLYRRHTLLATGRAEGDSRLAHVTILERLAANQRIAESEGWTSLAHERVAGMGQLRLWGVPAVAERREVVPDWAPR
jgi:hypothetical protein